MTSSRSWPLHAFLLFALLPAAAVAQGELPPAEQYTLRLEYLWWSPQIRGELQKGFSQTEGTLLDVQTDLGIQKHAANPLRGTLRFGGSWKLNASWSRLDSSGDVIAARGFLYGTVVVLPEQRVLTSLKGNTLTADLEWELVQRSRGTLGLLLGVKYFDVDTTLLAVRDEQNVDRVVDSERLPLPVAGLTARVYPLRRVSLEASFSGLPAGDRGHVYEILLAGRLHLSDRIAATVGWRKLALEGHDDRDYLKVDLAKWTFGVEISL